MIRAKSAIGAGAAKLCLALQCVTTLGAEKIQLLNCFHAFVHKTSKLKLLARAAMTARIIVAASALLLPNEQGERSIFDPGRKRKASQSSTKRSSHGAEIIRLQRPNAELLRSAQQRSAHAPVI